MTKLEKIERDIASLAPDELARLRQWFADFEASRWDARFEADTNSDKLDALADSALAAHREGRTRPL